MGKTLETGLFGFGVVGRGLYDILSAQDLNIEIARIAIKDDKKPRSLPAELFTTSHSDILDDESIGLVVELINDADTAYNIVKTALLNGKDVVTANKKMLAEHFNELLELQRQTGRALLYEGAVCGSIPIIRNLEEYYNNEFLSNISGIFNGSSNYILSKMYNEGLSYGEALKQAQELGFAESDPLLDVGGYDPKYKLSIITAHAFGSFIPPEQILNIGIQNISVKDINYAREKNRKIKLVPYAQKTDDGGLQVLVLPKLTDENDILYNVENEYNGVSVQAGFADRQFFYGKGAGGHPTGAAVLSDITALRYNYRYEYKKHNATNALQYNTQLPLRVYLRYNDEGLLDKLQFTDVEEQYTAHDYKYVTGVISLSELLQHKDAILADGAFVAYNGL